MDTFLIKQFVAMGLSEVEAKVYLASYALGPSSVQIIAREAGVSRTAGYRAVESLQKRELLTTKKRGVKTQFVAEDPRLVIEEFEREANKRMAEVEQLRNMLPEIHMLAGGEKPMVRFYEGDEAIRAAYRDVMSENPNAFDEVSNLEDINKHLRTESGELIEVVQEVQKVLDPARIKMRLLYRGEFPNGPRKGVAHRGLKEAFVEFHGNIWIYTDRVVFISFTGKVMSAIIQSQRFADTARVLYEAAWSTAKVRS